ncbi:MAG: serine/threonine protein kinase, partial [Anaerolineae bacterium]|nr:serine/threonine protein kinase [Anaerolineae bacterium]
MSIENLSGRQLGKYQLKKLLGIGGMGAVYQAFQTDLKRYVAIKVLPPAFAQEPGYAERFDREAQTAARLEHSHIVPVYDYGVQDGITYVVMRLLTGGSLVDRIQERQKNNAPLPSLREIADILKQLASALDYAHSEGVVHRDIKASNVMFDNQGSAFLVDFGIAKLVNATSALTNLTSAGAAMGTPSYMAPEQWRGDAITGAADQYALGVMTYAMVTGRMPFEADTPYAYMHKHFNEMPTPPEMLRSGLPENLKLVLARALAKEPGERYPTVTAFAQAFER